MQRHRPALPIVRDLDLQPKHVPKLTLKSQQVGIYWLSGCIPRTRASDVVACTWLDEPRPFLGLPDREALGDDLASQFFRLRSRSYGARVTHSDIASH